MNDTRPFEIVQQIKTNPIELDQSEQTKQQQMGETFGVLLKTLCSWVFV